MNPEKGKLLTQFILCKKINLGIINFVFLASPALSLPRPVSRLAPLAVMDLTEFTFRSGGQTTAGKYKFVSFAKLKFGKEGKSFFFLLLSPIQFMDKEFELRN